MAKWIIKYKNKFYAEIEFEKEFRIIEQSGQATKDKLQDKLNQEWHVFDPRHNSVKFIKNPKNALEADMILTSIFATIDYDMESENVGWEKVLTHSNEPGIVH